MGSKTGCTICRMHAEETGPEVLIFDVGQPATAPGPHLIPFSQLEQLLRAVQQSPATAHTCAFVVWRRAEPRCDRPMGGPGQ